MTRRTPKVRREPGIPARALPLPDERVVAGAEAPLGKGLSSPFLFSFDAEENSLLQFFVMSLPGFVATAVAVYVFYGFLPDAYLASRVARGGVLFLALLGLVLELPLLVFGIVTGGVPKQVSV